MDDSRGFALSHQRVVLDVNFAGVLTGIAYLTINPTSPTLRTLYLHASPLLQIRSVSLSSPHPQDPLLETPASYTLSQPFQPIPPRNPPIDIRSHTEIKRKTWAAIGERDEGELAISVSGGWIRVVQGDGQNVTLAPIEVKIEYRLALGGDVVEGIVFEQGEDKTPHMYLSPTTYDAARIWTPCVDNLWERCTWELEFIVPTHLEGGEDIPVTVVSSGELIEQTTHPHSPSKTIFYYLQSTPTSVQHIQFAAGPFEMLTITETPKPIIGFCLPEDMDLLPHSTSFLPRAMSFYSTEFGSYPFTEYKLVFVRSPRTPCSTSATLSIVSSDLLFPPSVIDQAIETRQVLALALIQQWVGINIIQRTMADTWVIHGLALYLQSLFLKDLLGNNEYRFRLKRDIDRCVRLDQGDQWPLCVPGRLDAPDVTFINLKAPLVMHILDRHLAKAGTSLGLARVIPRIFLAALSDELPGNSLSTHFFFRTCRKVSGVDLQTFQDQWVFASGCPRFRISTSFSRKKFVVEFNLTQTQPAATEDSIKRPASFFEGSLTVRIHEADGAPFEHVVDVKTSQKTSNLPFNTKYKRTRRTNRMAQRLQQLHFEQDEEEDQEETRLKEAERAETFAYPPWDDPEERERWRVADWNDEQAEQMFGEGGGYEWIRLDPDLEWLASFEYVEKPWYWVSQLQGDRDVVAQLEAIQNISVQLYPVMATELAKTILVKNFYYRVRIEAANALVNFCNAETDYLGVFLLLKIFHELYCYPDGSDPADGLSEVKPNDFSDLPDYFLKKAIIGALAGCRETSRRTSPDSTRKTLLNILRSNDNTGNKYSDSHYLAVVVTAIGNAFSASETEGANRVLLKEATEMIERVMTLDRLVPSFHNVISEAGLKTRMKLVVSGHQTNDARPYLGYTREGNFERLRLTAFDCLLLCQPPGRSDTLLRYLMEVIKNDSSLVVRRHLARALSESMLMSLAVGDVPIAPPAPEKMEPQDLEEDIERKRSDAFKSSIVKSLRKEFGKKVGLREQLQSELLTAFTSPDDEIRFALIKAAEILTGATPEPLPGNIITLATPTVETPAVTTPRIRLSLTSGSGSNAPPETQDGYPFPAVDNAPSLPIKLVISGKKEKVKPAHKSQSKGLSDLDRTAIKNALTKLTSHSSSFMFRQPVDPIRDNAPDYLTIIKSPMDLSTAQAKFDNGMYTNRMEFVADIRQIVKNCHMYNAPGSPVYKVGQQFEQMFEKLWAKTETTLSKTTGKGTFGAGTQASDSRPMYPAAANAVTIPPPGPPPPVKLKLKPIKSVSIDPTPQEWVPPMAPPPLPPSRKASASGPPTPSTETSGKKRKEPSKNTGGSGLDDLLGAEIDAIEKKGQSGDAIEELLGPASKKIKLPKLPKASSPEKLERPVQPERPDKGKQFWQRKPFPNSPSIASRPQGEASPHRSSAATPSLKLKSSASPRNSPAVQSPHSATVSPVPPSSRSVPPPAAVPLPPVAAPSTIVGYSQPRPPADLPPTTDNSMPFKAKRAKSLVLTLQKSPSAAIFLRPVNPIQDGCPTYLDEIKEPMDLGTILKKVEQKKYKTMGELAYDIELVFKNCRQFNVPGDQITLLADVVEGLYWKEWPKTVSPKMTGGEKKDMSALLARALKEPVSYFFREAVDPVALGIPTYFDVIPVQDARDLSLIKRNLEKGQYASGKNVDDDVHLMIENAEMFNGTGPVVDAAQAFAKWWEGQRARME